MKVRFWVESYYLKYWCSNGGSTQKVSIRNTIVDTVEEIVDNVMVDFKEYYSTHGARTYYPCYGGMANHGYFFPFQCRIMKGKDNYPTVSYNEIEKKYEVLEEKDIWRSELVKYFNNVCKKCTPIDLKETKYILGHSFMCTYNYDENGNAYCDEKNYEDYMGLMDISRLGWGSNKLWREPWGGQDLFHVEFGIICEEEDNDNETL